MTIIGRTPEHEPASPTRSYRAGRVGLIITVLVCAPVIILLTWPQAFGAQGLPGIAQLIALRAPLALALLAVSITAAAVALLFRRRARVPTSIAMGIAVATLASSIGSEAP